MPGRLSNTHALSHAGLHAPSLVLPPSHLQVRFRLRYQGEAVGSSGSQLPALQAAQGHGQQETDDRGRAFLGDLAIAEGSGEGQDGVGMVCLCPHGRTAKCKVATLCCTVVCHVLPGVMQLCRRPLLKQAVPQQACWSASWCARR